MLTPSSSIACLVCRQTTSLPYSLVLCSPHPYQFSPSFPRPVQMALFRAWLIILFLSPVGLHSCVWEPLGVGGFILSCGQANWNWLAVLHFPPASYIIWNFSKLIALLAACFQAGFLLALFFCPENLCMVWKNCPFMIKGINSSYRFWVQLHFFTRIQFLWTLETATFQRGHQQLLQLGTPCGFRDFTFPVKH
jgi:hypothetical protein